MAKVKPHEISEKEGKRIIFDFLSVVDRLKTKKEISDFFLGLLTASEALMFARRIQIARMLIEGKSYGDIKNRLRVGTNTIQRADRWLHKGDSKDFEWLMKVIAEGKEKENKQFQKESMLNRYPQHRFWSELFE